MAIFGMVTTKHSESYTPYALQSFFTHTPFSSSDRFLLIDNDGSYQFNQSQYSAVELHRNERPLGFAENANHAVRRAFAEKQSLVFLNNDLIFSAGWFEALNNDRAIRSPLSNRELQYKTGMLDLQVAMALPEYLGKESVFDQIVEAHRTSHTGFLNVLAAPFFAIFIPLTAINAVGLFDTSFGRGGAEDYDYCLRAHLAQIPVQYSLSSYILHFGGKSSWSGAESKAEQESREKIFFDRFTEKWGEPLKAILLQESQSVLTTDQQRAVQDGSYGEVIRELAVTLPELFLDPST